MYRLFERIDASKSASNLPREVGVNPNTNEMITAGLGRFGPYVKHGTTYVSLKGEDDVLTVGLNRAVELVETAIAKKPPSTEFVH